MGRWWVIGVAVAVCCIFVVVTIYGFSMAERLHSRFFLAYLLDKVSFMAKGKSREGRERMVMAALPGMILGEQRFLRGLGYWPKLYMGYLDCARVEVARRNYPRARMLFLRSLEYHPYYTSALGGLAIVYRSEGRGRRGECCKTARDAILKARWGAKAKKAYDCCLGGAGAVL